MSEGTKRVLRIVLSDIELATAIDLVTVRGGPILYPKAWGLLMDEVLRRADGHEAETIRMPGVVFDTLPSAVRVFLRRKVTAELRLAA